MPVQNQAPVALIELTNDTSEKQPASISGRPIERGESRKKPTVATAKTACLSWGDLIKEAPKVARPKHAIELTRMAINHGCG